MPIWTAELIWLRLIKAAKESARDAGDREVLDWPAVCVADKKQRGAIYTGLQAHIDGDVPLEVLAKERHGVSRKTLERWRKKGCREIAKCVNERKWAKLLQNGHSGAACAAGS